MRSRLAAAAALTAMLCCAQAAARPAQRSRCLPRGARTLAVDSGARVVAVGARTGPPGPGPAGGERVFACLFTRGDFVRLGAPTAGLGEGGVGVVALSGTVVAYGESTGGIDFFDARVAALDIATGHQLFDLPAATSTGRPESFYGVDSIAISPRLSVAWIGSRSSIFETPVTYEVHTVLASGRQATLDCGPGISPGSLRLAQGTLTWTDGRSSRSAPLP